MAETIISTHNLSLKAGQRYLLQDITWQVERGQHWLIFGLNGCGKTTLLSILAGFRQPSGGTVEILGQRYTAENILALRQQIGWVSSSFFEPIYSREAALDIVLSGLFGTVGLARGVSDNDVKRAKNLLRALRLGEMTHRPFHLLSKGQRQNVLIARALIGRPRILLLDEPCTGLDVIAREQLLHTVAELARQGEMTVIYVTHHTEEIMADIFTRCLFLRDGLCVAQEDTAALFTAPRLSELLQLPVQITPQTYRGLECVVQPDTATALALLQEVNSR